MLIDGHSPKGQRLYSRRETFVIFTSNICCKLLGYFLLHTRLHSHCGTQRGLIHKCSPSAHACMHADVDPPLLGNFVLITVMPTKVYATDMLPENWYLQDGDG